MVVTRWLWFCGRLLHHNALTTLPTGIFDSLTNVAWLCVATLPAAAIVEVKGSYIITVGTTMWLFGM